MLAGSKPNIERHSIWSMICGFARVGTPPTTCVPTPLATTFTTDCAWHQHIAPLEDRKFTAVRLATGWEMRWAGSCAIPAVQPPSAAAAG